MYDPEGTDNPNEFVEIYNSSETDSVNLNSWIVRDASSEDMIVDGGMGTTLPPLSFGLIMEADYEHNDSSPYFNLIPDSVTILKIDGPAIGNALNKTDSLKLINTEGIIVDSVSWDDEVEPGYSLERIRLDLPGEPENWTSGLEVWGTPGFVNSVTPAEIDGAISENSIFHTPSNPSPSDFITFNITVFNEGLNEISGTVEISEDFLILGSSSFTPTASGDSTILSINIGLLSSGHHSLTIQLNVEDDLNQENNTLGYELSVQYTERVATLNEFMYYPEENNSEFIEIFILSENSINLSGWGISDQLTSSIKILPDIETPSSSFVVIAKDSSLLPSLPSNSILLVPENGFPSLNNSGDSIYLYDPSGNVMDSLTYTDDWGVEGRSMEKLNPEMDSSVPSSWGTCVAPGKMTPGNQNSIFIESLPGTGTISLEPNPFSPDGDGYEDNLYISYSLPFPQAYLTITIFDRLGRTVRTLAKNLVSGAEGVITWNGRKDNSSRARIGIYILKITAVETGTSKKMEWVETAVLAEQLTN
tara:strand:+ start:13418 stop:15016 length:1599 start_codon:yes stop_codon:yes gene_type:complete